MKVRDDCCKFAEKYVGSELAVVALELLAEMKKASPTVKGCRKCKLKSCRRGKHMLNSSAFELGERVQFNPGAKDHVVSDVRCTKNQLC